MKKKLLTQEALSKVLAAGKKESTASAASGDDVQTGTTEEAAVETTAAEQSHDDTADDGIAELAAAQAQVTELTAGVAERDERITALQTELDGLRSQLETERKQAAEQLTPFKELVAEFTSGMRTALDLADVDMTAMDNAQLLAEYKRTSEAFEKSYPVGGVTTGTVAAEEKKTPVMDSTFAGKVAALGF